MLPSAEALHLRRVRRNLFGVLSEQDLEGNRNPQGGAAEAEERVAAGRMKSPEAVTETKAGYKTADPHGIKVLICTLAAEVRRNRSLIRATKDFARRVQSATAVAYSKALLRPRHRARKRVRYSSRTVSKIGNRIAVRCRSFL